MTALRSAVLVAVLSGQVAAATAGVLPWAALPVVLLLTAGAAGLTARADDRRARLLRAAATAVAVLLVVAILPTAVSSGEPREVLGPLLVGVSVLQALTWRARRDLQSGLLAAVGLLVLGASFAPDVLVGLPLLVGWGAALTAGVLSGRARTTEGADLVLTRGRGDRRGLLAATSLAAVLGLVAFLLVPAPQDAGLRSRIAAVAGSAGVEAVTRGALGAGLFTSGRVDLRIRGELGDTPLLEVDAGSPELWRGAVYDTWDGRSWQLSAPGLTELPGPPYVVEDVAPTRLDTARVVGPSDGTVLAPGRPVRIDSPAGRVLATADGAVRTDGVDGYRVASVVLPAPAPARDGVDDPRWRQLPPTLPARVRTLAAELTAGLDRPSAVAAVEDWLRSNATYRTDSPVPGRGEDAVDRFLFVDRTGFCEQFAAAGVVLLRAAGIPARFVSGVAYGTPGADGRRVYREKDLHTWVEVFHPGVGWVTSDPTAGAPRAESAAASLRSRLATPLAAALRRADAVPGGRPALAGALLLATAFAVVVRRPRRRRRAADERAAGPALAAFLLWDGRRGPAGRAPAESLGELRRRLPPEEAQAVAVVERECYAAHPPDDDEVAAAVSALGDGWSADPSLR